MGGAPGSNQQGGNLAQRANPNAGDSMQNMNPNGFPRGRNIMGGAPGGGAPGGLGGAPRPVGGPVRRLPGGAPPQAPGGAMGTGLPPGLARRIDQPPQGPGGTAPGGPGPRGGAPPQRGPSMADYVRGGGRAPAPPPGAPGAPPPGGANYQGRTMPLPSAGIQAPPQQIPPPGAPGPGYNPLADASLTAPGAIQAQNRGMTMERPTGPVGQPPGMGGPGQPRMLQKPAQVQNPMGGLLGGRPGPGGIMPPQPGGARGAGK